VWECGVMLEEESCQKMALGGFIYLPLVWKKTCTCMYLGEGDTKGGDYQPNTRPIRAVGPSNWVYGVRSSHGHRFYFVTPS
jgi:hypothetical protein